jgi:hypothetical protein
MPACRGHAPGHGAPSQLASIPGRRLNRVSACATISLAERADHDRCGGINGTDGRATVTSGNLGVLLRACMLSPRRPDCDPGADTVTFGLVAAHSRHPQYPNLNWITAPGIEVRRCSPSLVRFGSPRPGNRARDRAGNTVRFTVAIGPAARLRRVLGNRGRDLRAAASCHPSAIATSRGSCRPHQCSWLGLPRVQSSRWLRMLRVSGPAATRPGNGQIQPGNGTNSGIRRPHQRDWYYVTAARAASHGRLLVLDRVWSAAPRRTALLGIIRADRRARQWPSSVIAMAIRGCHGPVCVQASWERGDPAVVGATVKKRQSTIPSAAICVENDAISGRQSRGTDDWAGPQRRSR